MPAQGPAACLVYSACLSVCLQMTLPTVIKSSLDSHHKKKSTIEKENDVRFDTCFATWMISQRFSLIVARILQP